MSVFSATGNLLRKTVDLLFPPTCLSCGERISVTRYWLCEQCIDKLPLIANDFCPKCGRPETPADCPACAEFRYAFDQARAVYLYEGVVKNLIHKLKYDDGMAIAPWLALRGYEYLRQREVFLDADLLTAVPLHPVRLRERGYNQSRLIAGSLAKLMQKPYSNALVVQKKYHPSQTMLTRTDRIANLCGVFKKGNQSCRGKRVLLIDDVFTTGTTVNETAKILLAAGALKVYVLTICHGV